MTIGNQATIPVASTPLRSSLVTFGALSVCLAALALLGTAFAGKAEAEAPIISFETTPTSTQAGGHGDLLVGFTFRPDLAPEVSCDCNVPKEVTVDLPSGTLGIPRNIPRCTFAEFSLSECPVESQVGVASVLGFPMAIFNMVPRSDQLALLANETPFAPGQPIYVSFTLRTESDFGLESKAFGLPRGVGITRFDAIFWGIPGDPFHNALRFPLDGWGEANFAEFNTRGQILCSERTTTSQLLQGINPLRDPDGICADTGVPGVQPVETPYNGEVRPFLITPTNCTGPLQSSIEALAYDLETDHATAPFPAITGCDQLSFDPSLTAKPTTTDADAPSGLDAELTVPVAESAYVPTPSQIKAVKLVLPEGFSVNSGAANGKISCTDQQARFGTREPAQCPEFSKIGTLEVGSSGLPAALPGAIYLGAPLPGNRYRIFLTAEGFSLKVKLAGYATLDSSTGQVTVHFDELPQAPFERFTFHIFGAERGLLTTPEQCGTYPVKTEFTPWDNELPNQTSTQFFTIDHGPNGGPCPASTRPFGPEVNSGITDNTGGKHTDFVFDLNRDDGDQNLSGLEVHTPPGFSGILAGIPYCPDATLAALAAVGASGILEQSAPACSASQIGTAVASAGAGTRPVSLDGRVYLAGPYKGSPLSLAVVTPAVSGPYDLGNVVVRAAIKVDPVTAEITTVSDPLPQIIDGILLRLRRVLVMLDREDFALNPTNCSRFSVDSSLSGDEGSQADISVPFQVANCAILPFEPKLALKLSGGAKRTSHPRLRATLRANKGDANLASTSVAMPHSIFLDNAHLRNICTRADYAESNCPKASIYGHATAFTPLLDEPLRGPVYLRSSGKALPDLVLALHGQVDFEAIAHIDSKNQGIRTTFDFLPDVPLSKVVLNMQGGSKGLLQISSDSFCTKPGKAVVHMSAQNGRRSSSRVELQTSCAKAKKKKRPHRSKAGAVLHRKAA